MNGAIFRCGNCGRFTDEAGDVLPKELFNRAEKLVDDYGDYRTTKLYGECCYHETFLNRGMIKRGDSIYDNYPKRIKGEFIDL